LDGYDNIKERLKKRAAGPVEPDKDDADAGGGGAAAGAKLKEALASGDGAAICAAVKACSSA
jgi:hypothetical protein